MTLGLYMRVLQLGFLSKRHKQYTNLIQKLSNFVSVIEKED